MRPNRLRQLFAADRTAIAGWLTVDSAFAAELVGSADFDAVVIEAMDFMRLTLAHASILNALTDSCKACFRSRAWARHRARRRAGSAAARQVLSFTMAG